MIERNDYLQQLINLSTNNLVKVITGMRRSGKTFLLFNIFNNYLRNSLHLQPWQILEYRLDLIENQSLWDPNILYDDIKKRINDKDQFYILIDEIQLVPNFEFVLNSLLINENIQIYVTGSNARFLSKDIITEFRGRGISIYIQPLSFKEFFTTCNTNKQQALEEYMLFGGLPQITTLKTPEAKKSFLNAVLNETYIKDIIQRHQIRTNSVEIEEIMDILCSTEGSLVSYISLSRAFKSIKNKNISDKTIKRYIHFFEDSFLIEKSKQYNIKGKKYITSCEKYYFTDLGIRNSKINFRQVEKTHDLECVIYNELRRRGYSVDVGSVDTAIINKQHKMQRCRYEVDFVCNKGYQRYYIQCTYSLESREKRWDEERPFKYIKDSYKKIIITYDSIPTHYDDNGVLIMDIYNFLLDANSLEK